MTLVGGIAGIWRCPRCDPRSLNATSSNTASTLVARDVSGNFTASTITSNLIGNVTGSLAGNASTATLATTATTATNFSGALVGDVTGTQSATVVSLVGGTSASQVAAGTALALTSTSTNTPSSVVLRDASGNFSAATISSNVIGNLTGNVTGNATTATTATNFTGSLSGDVTGTQTASVVSLVGGQTATNVAAGTVQSLAATASNTPSTIIMRDASGNFTASTITAAITGNVTGNLIGNASTATSATNANNFLNALVGDVTGTQTATVVSLVGGQTAANVAAATTSTLAASSSNAPSTIVSRDSSGNFTAGTITATTFVGALSGNATTATSATSATTATTSTSFTGSLTGDVTGTQSATVVGLVGGQTASAVATATLATLAATPNNNPSTIVERDASGHFAVQSISISAAPVNPTDGANKAYVDQLAALGITPVPPAQAVATTNVSTLSGLQTIDGVSLIAGNTVLLVAQTDPTTNGVWTIASGAWTRPSYFANGSQLGRVYVLILGGTVNAGSSWLSSSAVTSVIGTDPINFSEFSLPNQTTGANVGVGSGQIFRDVTGVTLNFKTVIWRALIF